MLLVCRLVVVFRYSKGWYLNFGLVVVMVCEVRDLVNVLVGGDEDIVGLCGFFDEIMEVGGYSE